jgi:hypothetical protein
MRGVSSASIAVSLAATWLAHTSATAEPPSEEPAEGKADDLYDNVITVDDLYELFTQYLVERGVSAEDGRRIADSAREGLKKCTAPDQGCFTNVLQEHGLLDAMQWILAKVHSR